MIRVSALDTVAASRDLSRPVATAVAHQQSEKIGDQPRATTPDQPRQAATEEGESSRYVAQLEKRIEEKDVVINVLRGELAHRNDEIIRRNERERETNILIRGLQNLVLQLQPGRARTTDVLDDDPLMKTGEARPAATPSPAPQQP